MQQVRLGCLLAVWVTEKGYRIIYCFMIPGQKNNLEPQQAFLEHRGHKMASNIAKPLLCAQWFNMIHSITQLIRIDCFLEHGAISINHLESNCPVSDNWEPNSKHTPAQKNTNERDNITLYFFKVHNHRQQDHYLTLEKQLASPPDHKAEIKYCSYWEIP